jgi:hypothetical protein
MVQLLKPKESEQLKTHYLKRGQLENIIINEKQKHYHNQVKKRTHLFFAESNQAGEL